MVGPVQKAARRKDQIQRLLDPNTLCSSKCNVAICKQPGDNTVGLFKLVAADQVLRAKRMVQGCQKIT